MKTLQQRKGGTTCVRCRGVRWPLKDWITPYTCQRCAEVLAGGQAIDPLGSVAQQAARAVSGARFRQARASSELPAGRARAPQRGTECLAGPPEGVLMAGRRRLVGGAPRMLGKHDGIRGKWYRECWRALLGEYGALEGLRRLEAGRVCVAWVQLRTATEAMEEARHRAETGLGRRPGPRDLERLARRQGLADASYSQALAALTERMTAKRRQPTTGRDLLRLLGRTSE